MSFDKELKVVMISAIGILVYLLIASGIMLAIFTNFGMTAFLVTWLVVLLIPVNFALCSLVCIIFYKKKEKNFNEIKEQLTELSELAVECDKKRDDRERVPGRSKISAEAL